MPHDLEVAPGIYQHYKGDKYRVLFVATNATNEQERNKVVVYISLKDGSVYYRDLGEFTEIVEWPDGGRKSRFIGAYTSFKKRVRKQ
ncbi:MAG: DUF1653 domain-containing protein [Patescibacteria group bacterium]